LYRCVEDKPGYWTTDAEGRPIVATSAFFDPTNTPSVDQASRRGHDPRATLRGPTDGVAVLLTLEVREIGDVYREDPKTRQRTVHEIDVLHRPVVGHATLSDNLAHAEITPAPAIRSKSVFTRLRVALTQLAKRRPWAIEPRRPI
jgi:hypothetical protein